MLYQTIFLAQCRCTSRAGFQNFQRLSNRHKTNDSISDRLRRSVESLKDSATKATRDAASPENVNKVKYLLREKSQKFYEVSQPMASSLMSKAKKAGSQSLSAGMEATSAIAAKTGQVAKRRIDSAKRSALNKSTAAKKSTKLAIESASNSASSGVQSTTNAITKPLVRIRDRFDGKAVTRWVWWWSLAAIGVYGVSTTIPKELIRQAFRNKEEDKND